MPTYTGKLSGADSKDKCCTELPAGDYAFTLIVSGKGKAGLRIGMRTPQTEGRARQAYQRLLEFRSKVRGGNRLTGQFSVPAGSDSHNHPLVEFDISRRASGNSIGYELHYHAI